MTYLFKLARRISSIRPAMLLAGLAASACAKGDQVDNVGPTPNSPPPVAQVLRVEPQIATAEAGTEIQFTATAYTVTGTQVPATVDWTATGGNILPDGRFIGDINGNYTVTARVRGNATIADSARVSVSKRGIRIVEVIVTPDSAIVQEGDTVRADAVLRLEDGTLAPNAAVTWSTTGGSVDDVGNFVAPVPGAYALSAHAANGVEGRATVVVHNRKRNVVSLAVSPSAINMVPGQSTAFIGTVGWSDGSTGATDLVWSATGGTIGSDGMYTAGSVGGNYLVVARHRAGTIADTAEVTITPPSVSKLAIAPGSAALSQGASQQFSAMAQLSDGSWHPSPVTWSAPGGNISAQGLYTAGNTLGTFKVIAAAAGIADTVLVTVAKPATTLVSVSLNPSSATVPTGQTRQFGVTAQWSDGTTLVPLLTWTATGGSVSASGLYTAGATPGTYAVTAKGPGGVGGTAVVTIAPPVLAQMDLSPAIVSVQAGQTVQFSLSGVLSNGAATTPAVNWTVAGGTMDGSSLFTAGTRGGTYAIVATAQGSTVADTSLVTVTVPPPTLISLVLTPASRVMAPGSKGDFNVLGTWSDGTTGTPAVTYTATGGTLAGRVFTAGSVGGSFRVIAQEIGGTHADTSAITITSPVQLTGLTLSPKPATVIAGVTKQFTVGATWSNGTTAVPLVTLSATGGTITTSGRYTAGTTPGNYRVWVRDNAGVTSDSTDVTVLAGTAPTATLVGISITPNPVALLTGGTAQFGASAVWSDGTTTLPALTWTATGGTISSSGLYTAGSTAGTYRVISTGGGVADTAVVTVTTPPAATLTSVVLTPGSTALTVGSTQQFTASGKYSDGSTGPVSVTWSATGGVVSSAGLYSAGMSTGTYRVIATQVSGTQKDTATVTLAAAAPPPPPSSGWYPNEPGGMTFINERKFDAKVENGWGDRGDANFSIVSDPTAPRSSSNVGQARYPAGFPSGTGPIATWSNLPPNLRTLYVCYWIKVSSNWFGNMSGTNKVMFFQINGSRVFSALRGIGPNPLGMEIDFQGMGTHDETTLQRSISWNGWPNLNSAAGVLTRGSWAKWEVLLVANTPGQYDGQAHWWINGVKVGQYTALGYSSATETGSKNTWGSVVWNPTYGGGGAAVPADQNMWIDHIYISGK